MFLFSCQFKIVKNVYINFYVFYLMHDNSLYSNINLQKKRKKTIKAKWIS